jgi:hypothetical protein
VDSRRRIGFATAAAAFSLLVGSALALVACGSSSNGSPGKLSTSTAKDFDRANFPAAPKIDNKWSPLAPGTQFIMAGRANRGHRRRPHRVVFTVTDLTKVIDGVRTVVLWDRDYNGGRLQEGELTFFAQDDDGVVWNLGEYPEEYDHGRFTGAPDTWIAGLAGAQAGIQMRADPRTGTSSYLQGFAPDIDFRDRARVYKTGQKSCIPITCYEDVLVTEEWNPDEPGARQLKYYAPGVGNIRVGTGGRDKEAETLILLAVVHLDAKKLAKIRKGAVALERRAYVARRDLFRHTPRAERTLRAAQAQ